MRYWMSVLCVVWCAGSAFAAEKTLELDASKSQMTFTSTAPAEKIVGTAPEVSGSVVLDLETLDGKGRLELPAEKLNTGNRLRDRHLVGKDWLDAKSHPKIVFEVTGIKDAKDVVRQGEQLEFSATAVGQVTVNGVASASSAQVKVKLDVGKSIARIEPVFKVRLAEHKVSGKKGVIGDKVGEEIELTGVLYARLK